MTYDQQTQTQELAKGEREAVMVHILAQMAEEPVYDPVMTVLWLAILLLPLVLLVVLMISYRRYVRFARAHTERSEQHMERVEALLEQIAANTAKHSTG